MKQIPILFLAALSLCAQTAVYPGAAATDANLGAAVNHIETALIAPMKATDTRMFVLSVKGIVPNTILTVDSEEVWACGAAGSIVYLGKSSCPNIDGRGIESIAAAHALNAQVRANIDAWHHNSLKAEVEALERNLVNGPHPLGDLPGGNGVVAVLGG